MSSRPFIVAAAAVTFLAGCDCAQAFQQGTLTVVTDCDSEDGSPRRVSYPFAKFPESAASGLQTYFALDLSGAEEELARTLDCPVPDGFAVCEPRGGGLQPDASSQLVRAGAALCGTKLLAVGPLAGEQGVYVCKASSPAVEGQLWALDCQRMSPTGEPAGECRGMASFRSSTGI